MNGLRFLAEVTAEQPRSGSEVHTDDEIPDFTRAVLAVWGRIPS